MIYHQFVTIEQFKQSLLWFPTHFSNMVHTLDLECYPFNQLCTQMAHHFSYLIWATMTYEPTIHIRDL